MINSYLKYLQETKHITLNSNAPCAAYEAVYEKKCPHIRGRCPDQHESKDWNGIFVDYHLDEKWLNDLSNIKGIEMRSSCEGHNKDWVSFIIFRFTKKCKYSPEEIEKRIEATDNITKCSAHIGRGEGQLRIVVAAPTWYGHKDWEKWWSTLAKRIKKAIS